MSKFQLAIFGLVLAGCGGGPNSVPPTRDNTTGAPAGQTRSRNEEPLLPTGQPRDDLNDSKESGTATWDEGANATTATKPNAQQSDVPTSEPSDKLPSGQSTPEGVACDAIMAYFHSDSEAWLATLVRPIYGEAGDSQYAEFKEKMAATITKNKADESFKPMRIIKCTKAREFSKNGPGSAAFALVDMRGNKFVDVVVERAPGKEVRLRYHVLLDKDEKWYFEPRPDLCPLFSAGLNEESESTDVIYEVN